MLEKKFMHQKFSNKNRFYYGLGTWKGWMIKKLCEDKNKNVVESLRIGRSKRWKEAIENDMLARGLKEVMLKTVLYGG